MIARDSVVLPEPDSPTSARHSPPELERDVVQDLPIALERIHVAHEQDRLRLDLPLASARRAA